MNLIQKPGSVRLLPVGTTLVLTLAAILFPFRQQPVALTRKLLAVQSNEHWDRKLPVLIAAKAGGGTRLWLHFYDTESEEDQSILAAKLILTVVGQGDALTSVAWSPDGKRLATGSEDNTAKVWDAETGKELLTLSGHTWSVSSVSWAPDGERLATGSGDGTAKVWDVGL